jgi:hypothetical protein
MFDAQRELIAGASDNQARNVLEKTGLGRSKPAAWMICLWQRVAPASKE